MSIDFGPIPFPDSPIQDYFQRRISGSSGSSGLSTVSSSVSPPTIDEKLLESRLLAYIDNQKASHETLYSDEVDAMERLESQVLEKAAVPPPEYRVPLARKLTFLGLYFLLNISLTLSNKEILIELSAPWTLTAMHATTTSVGCWLLVSTGRLKLTKIGAREHLVLLAYSCLFTLNIAASNVSLALVTVPFHQVMRSTCPVVTVLIYRTVFGRSYQTQTYLSMIPLVLGVGLATLGDYSFTLGGFVITLLGVVLASTKTVVTNRMMTGQLALSPLELLTRMSPLAAIQCFFYAIANGEMQQVTAISASGFNPTTFLITVLGNSAIACLLNGVSFQTNKLAGALTMSICGNLKQCLTIILGIALFSVNLMPLNALGIIIAVSGAAWYSLVELRQR